MGKKKTMTPRQIEKAFSSRRMTKLIEEFGAIGMDSQGGVTRLAFGPEDLKAREKIKHIMAKELRLKVSVDAWGNIVGRRPGWLGEVPALMTGSHLDSVKNAGKFDGPAGILGGVEAFRALNALEIETAHPLELTVFTGEEPNPFGVSTIGSRGMAGKLTKEDIIGKKNDKGEHLPDAITRVGGNPDYLEKATRRGEEIEAFIEMHIEQMPYLEREHKDIGVVQGVAGIHRFRLTVVGEASHSGTTAMGERKDALVASAHLVTALDQLARSEDVRAVATVGSLSLQPNWVNIIPGRVVLGLEIRSSNLDSISRIEMGLKQAITNAEERTGVRVIQEMTYEVHPVTFSSRIRETIHRACGHLGLSSMDIVSMAGHDASHMSDITKSGMIFVPSHKGLSHCPEEWTEPEWLINGARVLLQTLLYLDQQIEVK